MTFNIGPKCISLTRAIVYLLTVVGFGVLYPRAAKAQAPVPPEFQDLYTSLNTYLDTFNLALAAGDGTSYPYMMAGNLLAANANSGPQLLNGLPFVQLQVNSLKAMGAKAIMVEVGFPVLYGPYLTTQGQSATALTSYYKQVATIVRNAGLKLVVENDTLQAAEALSGWSVAPYYATLNWAQYQQARASMALTVAQTMKPDYLVVLEEPDTETANTGQANVSTVAGATTLLSALLASVKTSGLTGMRVGAGVGTWLTGYDTFIASFVTQPLNFIDLHIYPVNLTYLPNALTVATIAKTAGLPVAITECWTHKIRDSELTTLTHDETISRDVYSFWAPLDAYFLQTMQNLANFTQMIFVSPFSSDFYYAYQDYNTTTENEAAAQLLTSELPLATAAVSEVVFTSTATAFYDLMEPTADKTPPASPTGVTATSGNPTEAYVTWIAATDNVGVAGYYVLRDGAVVATTAYLYYQDGGLTDGTTYTYTIEAFDFAGNISPASKTATVQTTNTIPPTTPQNVTAIALSCYRVSLTWSPSTDQTGVTSYLVFEGPAPGALTQLAQVTGTTTSYGNNSLTPGTTYYFGIEAADAFGNTSYMSTIVAFTTPSLPVAPASLTATPASDSKVSLSWTASAITGGLPIALYHVYRGPSASTLVQVATSKTTSYSDTTLTAGTIYYYAIQAVDTGTPPAQSGLSTPVSVTTYSPPAAPSNVQATATSTTKVNLKWSASVSGGLPISVYLIFRGSSATTLSQLAKTNQTSYTDSTVTATTTYYYSIEAEDTGGGFSAQSGPVPVTTFGPPGVPEGLTATSASTSKVNLSWSAAVSGGLPISVYLIFRGTTPSGLTQLTKLNKTSYTDTTVAASTTYYYAVEAQDSGGDLSGLSAAVPVTVDSPPSIPANLAAAPASATKINVSWSASVSGGLPISLYIIYRGTTSTGLTQLTKTTKTSYTDTTALASTTYYYAVEAQDSAGDLSGLSAPLSATTYGLPGVPGNVAATAASSTQVNITWSASTSGGLPVANYHVYRGTSPGALVSVGVTTKLSYSDASLTAGTVYYYAVEATDTAADASALSSPVSVTTLP